MPSADHRAVHVDPLELLGSEVERVVGQHREVGVLAGLDRADLVVHLEHVGRADGDRLESGGRADPLVLAHDASRLGEARDRVLRSAERTQRGDRGVGVDAQRHAEARGRRGSVVAAGFVGTHGDVEVLVAPGPDVVGEDVGARAEGR